MRGVAEKPFLRRVDLRVLPGEENLPHINFNTKLGVNRENL